MEYTDEEKQLIEEIQQNRKLLNTHKRHIEVLEQRAAKFGELYVPSHILLEIDDLNEKVQQCQKRIEDLKRTLPDQRKMDKRGFGNTSPVDQKSHKVTNSTKHSSIRSGSVPVNYRKTLISSRSLANMLRGLQRIFWPYPKIIIIIISAVLLAVFFGWIKLPHPINNKFRGDLLNIGETWESNYGKLTLLSAEKSNENTLSTRWRLNNNTSNTINLPIYNVSEYTGPGLRATRTCDPEHECLSSDKISPGETVYYVYNVEIDSNGLSREITLNVQNQDSSKSWTVVWK